MAIKTKQYESKTNPGFHYTAVLHEDGSATCNCKGFTGKAGRCWHADDLAGKKQIPFRPTAPAVTAPMARQESLFAEPQARFIAPMLASGMHSKKTFRDFITPEWVMEEKFDGHRLVVLIEDGEVHAWSRNGLPRALPVQVQRRLQKEMPQCMVDGELYIPGMTSTDVTNQDLAGELRFAIFDLMSIRAVTGEHYTLLGHMTQLERRAHLELACSKLNSDVVYVADQFQVSEIALQGIWERGGEGVILKHRDTFYEAGARTKTWVKVKRVQYAELTITGFREGSLGPHAVIELVDEHGVQVRVKALNDHWRAVFAQRAEDFIGKRVAIDYTIKTKDGKYQQPHADHFPNGEL